MKQNIINNFGSPSINKYISGEKREIKNMEKLNDSKKNFKKGTIFVGLADMIKRTSILQKHLFDLRKQQGVFQNTLTRNDETFSSLLTTAYRY